MLPPQLPPATLLLLLCWHLRALTGVSRARVLQDIKVHTSIKRNGRGSSAVESESVVRGRVAWRAKADGQGNHNTCGIQPRKDENNSSRGNLIMVECCGWPATKKDRRPPVKAGDGDLTSFTALLLESGSRSCSRPIGRVCATKAGSRRSLPLFQNVYPRTCVCGGKCRTELTLVCLGI
jgi:hypothetical protein